MSLVTRFAVPPQQISQTAMSPRVVVDTGPPAGSLYSAFLSRLENKGGSTQTLQGGSTQTLHIGSKSSSTPVLMQSPIVNCDLHRSIRHSPGRPLHGRSMKVPVGGLEDDLQRTKRSAGLPSPRFHRQRLPANANVLTKSGSVSPPCPPQHVLPFAQAIPQQPASPRQHISPRQRLPPRQRVSPRQHLSPRQHCLSFVHAAPQQQVSPWQQLLSSVPAATSHRAPVSVQVPPQQPSCPSVARSGSPPRSIPSSVHTSQRRPSPRKLQTHSQLCTSPCQSPQTPCGPPLVNTHKPLHCASKPALTTERVSEIRTATPTPRSIVSNIWPLKLVVFDFDCTLSVFHVFSSLAGCKTSSPKLFVPPPHARSEKGQLRKLSELDADPAWGPGAFAMKAFGGEKRVAQLRSELKALVDGGVECIVLSRGLAGPIRKCLHQLNLHTFFTHILANTGDTQGSSVYDRDASSVDEAITEGDYLGIGGGMDVGTASKSALISKLVAERGLDFSQVAYLDDDINEINQAASCCMTIHISKFGVCNTHLQVLRMMNESDACDAPAIATIADDSTSANSEGEGPSTQSDCYMEVDPLPVLNMDDVRAKGESCEQHSDNHTPGSATPEESRATPEELQRQLSVGSSVIVASQSSVRRSSSSILAHDDHPPLECRIGNICDEADSCDRQAVELMNAVLPEIAAPECVWRECLSKEILENRNSLGSTLAEATSCTDATRKCIPRTSSLCAQPLRESCMGDAHTKAQCCEQRTETCEERVCSSESSTQVSCCTDATRHSRQQNAQLLDERTSVARLESVQQERNAKELPQEISCGPPYEFPEASRSVGRARSRSPTGFFSPQCSTVDVAVQYPDPLEESCADDGRTTAKYCEEPVETPKCCEQQPEPRRSPLSGHGNTTTPSISYGSLQARVPKPAHPQICSRMCSPRFDLRTTRGAFVGSASPPLPVAHVGSSISVPQVVALRKCDSDGCLKVVPDAAKYSSQKYPSRMTFGAPSRARVYSTSSSYVYGNNVLQLTPAELTATSPLCQSTGTHIVIR